MGLSEFFEGVVSCDYGAGEFSCKPEREFFDQALLAITNPPPAPETLFFVDDSALNIRGANSLGWGNCVLFDEMKDEADKLGGLDRVAKGENGTAKVSVVHDMQGESFKRQHHKLDCVEIGVSLSFSFSRRSSESLVRRFQIRHYRKRSLLINSAALPTPRIDKRDRFLTRLSSSTVSFSKARPCRLHRLTTLSLEQTSFSSLFQYLVALCIS